MITPPRSIPVTAPRVAEAAPSAHDRVYRGLRSRIMFGQIAPGAALTLRGSDGNSASR